MAALEAHAVTWVSSYPIAGDSVSKLSVADVGTRHGTSKRIEAEDFRIRALVLLSTLRSNAVFLARD